MKFAFLLLATTIVFVVTDQYFFCPVYIFEKPSPFAGDCIYNPYSNIVESDWVKCNFHAHAHCWSGITNGSGTAGNIHNTYDSLDYGVHTVSNYQSIDTTFCTATSYISAYEHGYNMKKTHQLVMGANKVCWRDYLFPQTIYNKQNILNQLLVTDTNALVIINHPVIRNGYSSYDFGQLTNYSCIEVLNPACNASAFWDAALSAGKPVFATGNDDAHNVCGVDNIGRICTWINVPNISRNNIIHALKTGSSYAMTIGEDVRKQVRLKNYKRLPMLKSFMLRGNQLHVKFNMPMTAITVFGENGHVLTSVHHVDSILYMLGGHEPYARVTATYKNGTELLLNPVFRYHQSPLQQSVVRINSTKTIVLRITGVLALLLWLTFAFRIAVPKKFQIIQLRIINKYKHGYIRNNTYPKSYKVWHRGFIRHVYRFFYHLGLQRKNQAE